MDGTVGEEVVMSFASEGSGNLNSEKKSEIMLDLKETNIFVADQTPTPTRLIKNCEEVGLFEDLQHVNPFDETFRRAVEQQTGQTLTQSEGDLTHAAAEDSLHTPQVFPQLDTSIADSNIGSGGGGFGDCESASVTGVTLGVAAVDELLAESYKLTTTSRQNSGSSTGSSTMGYGKIQKYRSIMERSLSMPTQTEAPADSSSNNIPFVQMPTTIQLIQPQLITVSFPGDCTSSIASKKESSTSSIINMSTAIPVQTVKPFILPKLSTNSNSSILTNSSVSTQNTSTSEDNSGSSPLYVHDSTNVSMLNQLPIKERLKAILSSNNKARTISYPTELQNKTKTQRRQRGDKAKSQTKYDEDCIERRRAASTRYRNKIRNEHKDLRRKNTELQAENEKLNQRIVHLEQDLLKQKNAALQQTLGCACGSVKATAPAQIQIPSSTVHLVMNIPKLFVQPNGQPILQNPITYRVEKK